MDKRQHCLESEPTGLLRTDKGKNARRELEKQKKMDLDMKTRMMFGWIGMYRMCASNLAGHVNILLALIIQGILYI